MSANVLVTVYCNTKDNVLCLRNNVHDYLMDSTVLEFNYPLATSLDRVFYDCARICDIAPAYLTLFALRESSTGNKFWINLSSLLEEHVQSSGVESTSDVGSELLQNGNKIEIELRVRFTFKSECHLEGIRRSSHRYDPNDDSSKPVMSEKVIEYLFHQCRSDLLRIDIYSDLKPISVADGDLMGVALTDMVRLAREMNCDLNTVQRHIPNIKKLVPRVCRKHFLRSFLFGNMLQKWRFKQLRRRFAPKCIELLTSQHTIPYFHCCYIQNLEQVVGPSDTEAYIAFIREDDDDQNRTISVGADCGIVKDNGEKLCDFQDISDMNIQECQNVGSKPTWNVTISKLDGKVLTLSLSSLVEAENLASCIDGYYQLLVDAHHYLCKDVCSPSLVERLKYYCHGPISSAFAEIEIRSQSEPNVGDCLLRQSLEVDGEYFINTVTQVHPLLVIKNYKLNREDGFLGIYGQPGSHIHKDLAAFVEAYDVDQNPDIEPMPFQLGRRMHPNIDSKSNLLVCRSNEMRNQNEEPPAAPVLKPQDYTYEKVLGSSSYTFVLLQSSKTRREDKVVVKGTFQQVETRENGDATNQQQCIDDSFQDTLQNLLKTSCLKDKRNAFIVHLKGTMKNMIALEFVPFRSLTDYFHCIDTPTLEKSEWGDWLMLVLYQLAHACNYLEVKHCSHGNIRGKNVLLFEAFPRPHIKLGDSGVRTCFTTLNEQSREPVLPAPWLAYEFCRVNANNQFACINYPSVNGDKWSFATTVCEICNWGNLPVGPVNAYDLPVSMRNAYENANVVPIPETLTAVTGNEGELCSLIRQCWSSYPPKRPPFKQILRELGMILARGYVLPSVEPQQSITGDDANSDLKSFEDRELRKMQSLGKGNFGEVDLCMYKNEAVAVKSFHQSLNDGKSIREFQNEIETMRKCDHKYVVKLMGVANPSLRIVMEYLQDGCLLQYLSSCKKKGYPLAQLYETLYKFSSQISQGMLVLQEQRIIHRDLAARNILIARDAQSTLYAKIADFGLSRALKNDNSYYRGTPDQIPAEWYAPECLVFDHNSFSFESDVWSFGVTIWEMFGYGDTPRPFIKALQCRSVQELKEKFERGYRLPQPQLCPDAVYQLIKDGCWQLNHSSRIGFQELYLKFERFLEEYQP